MQKFLENNRHYVDKIIELENSTGKSILRKFETEKDDINFFSRLSEIKFGYLLLQIFRKNFQYEPNISKLTPDWLIEINGDKIIFEVLRINPKNEILNKIIDDHKNDVETPKSGAKITNGILSDYHKIFKKELTYRELIEQENYKLVVCIDASSFEKLIDIEDIKVFFDFDKITSPVFGHGKFVENIAGLIVIPFMGKTEFLENVNSQKQLNILNRERIKKDCC